MKKDNLWRRNAGSGSSYELYKLKISCKHKHWPYFWKIKYFTHQLVNLAIFHLHFNLINHFKRMWFCRYILPKRNIHSATFHCIKWDVHNISTNFCFQIAEYIDEDSRYLRHTPWFISAIAFDDITLRCWPLEIKIMHEKLYIYPSRSRIAKLHPYKRVDFDKSFCFKYCREWSRSGCNPEQ